MGFDSLAGLVLSGGRGSRHGGADKGWLEYQQRPLIETALQHLQGCGQVIISANRNQERYAEYPARVISDRRADYQGPLSGIESAFLATDVDWLYVMPVDVTGMPADWLADLRASVLKSGAPWCGTLDGDRLQPLLGLWSRELLEPMTTYLDRGERRVMRFVAPWAEQALPLPASHHLMNLNTPEALVGQPRG